MRGFVAGIVMGLGLGAAALAGLSLLGSRGAAVVATAPEEAGAEGRTPVARVPAPAEPVEEEVAAAPPLAEPPPREEPAVQVPATAPDAAAPVTPEAPRPVPKAPASLAGTVPPEAPEVSVVAPDLSEADATPPAGLVQATAATPEAAATVETDPGQASSKAGDGTAEARWEAEPVRPAGPDAEEPDLAAPAPVAEAPAALPPGGTLAPDEAPGTAAAPDLPAEAPAAPGPTGEVAALAEPLPAGAAPEGEGTAPSLPGRVRLEGSALPGRDAVRVNRPGAEEPAEAPAVEPEASVDVPAVRRYAAAFEAPAEARPLLSLVLLDDGAMDPQALAALPWPVSVALDPSTEGAEERLGAYRAAGVEALVVAKLPDDAQPVDAEVVLGAALEKLPETVAVLDLGEGGFGRRDATAQMAMSRVARDGRGVVLAEDGLGSGLDLAGRAGVPAAEVLRDLDGAGQDGPAIRRGLDDAVRRAGQEGRAVVLGRLRPETLAALVEWSQEGRAQEVTVAPVSGVLGR